MEPAYPLALTKDQHVLIGEIVEILGITDQIMMETVKPLNQQAVDGMKGESNAEKFVSPWAETVRGRTSEPDLFKLIDFAVKERVDIAETRHDFIHAQFVGNIFSPGYVNPGYQETSAIRFKTGKRRSTNELPDLRERAAMLSCVVAHIGHCIKSSGPSPWLDRVRPLLLRLSP
jgi:hypothetical protein